MLLVSAKSLGWVLIVRNTVLCVHATVLAKELVFLVDANVFLVTTDLHVILRWESVKLKIDALEVASASTELVTVIQVTRPSIAVLLAKPDLLAMQVVMKTRDVECVEMEPAFANQSGRECGVKLITWRDTWILTNLAGTQSEPSFSVLLLRCW